MTFTFKLSKRLARLRCLVLLSAVAFAVNDALSDQPFVMLSGSFDAICALIVMTLSWPAANPAYAHVTVAPCAP